MNQNISQTACIRLGEFIQSFDFSESMVKLDSKMWFALTVILLDILLPNKAFCDGYDVEDISSDGTSKNSGNHNQLSQKIDDDDDKSDFIRL